MTVRAALSHEKTAEHRQNVRAREEWGAFPVEWDVTTDVPIDQIRHFIPFWRKTIEAAEHGETLRFEDFMNALGAGGEREKDKGWDLPIPEWAIEPVLPADEPRSDRKEASQVSSVSSADVDHDAFNFVEKIAKMGSLDAQRKKRLHSFYKVSKPRTIFDNFTTRFFMQMPTNEKLKRIYELIDTLRTGGRTL